MTRSCMPATALQLLCIAITMFCFFSGRASADSSDRVLEAMKLMHKGESRTAIKMAQQLAEGGDPVAQYVVGSALMREGDTAQGIRWLTTSADSGEVRSMIAVADAYLNGNSVEKSVPRAIEILERAQAKNNNFAMLAQNKLGEIYQSTEYGVHDLQKAVSWHLKSAQAGFSVSQWALAHIQFYQLKKPDNTVTWASLAAAQSFRPAYKLVGLIHLTGFGVPINNAEAQKWLVRAFEAGAPEVAYELGQIYAVGGYGIERNMVTAVDWYKKGAEQNDSYALFSYSQALVRGTEVPRDEKMAFEYISKAVAAGHAPAYYYLGTLYERGIGVVVDSQMAFSLYDKAAKAGSLSGMVRLGRAYEQGIGIDQDYSEAMQWFRKAASLGDTAAYFDIGRLYNQGKGVAENRETAMKWFLQSALAGYPNAQYMLGRAYMGSSKFEHDIIAYAWLSLAARNGLALAEKLRAELLARMSAEQISKGSAMISAFTPRTPRIPEN